MICRMTSFAVTLPGSHHKGETSSACRSARTEAGRRRPASCQPCSHRRAARRDARQVMTCMSSTPYLCKFLQGICAIRSRLVNGSATRQRQTNLAANQPCTEAICRPWRNDSCYCSDDSDYASARCTAAHQDGALALGRAAEACSHIACELQNSPRTDSATCRPRDRTVLQQHVDFFDRCFGQPARS